MKKETKINVKMFRIAGDEASLVKVDFLDKDAQEHSGLFLLDSCSNDNMLSTGMADSIGIPYMLGDKTKNVGTSSGDVVTLKCAEFSFALGGTQFHESFCLVDRELPKVAGDTPLIGILGNIFMLENRLVIDYSDFSFHTSDVSPANLSISDCDFFVPMGIGLEHYSLPVLPIKQGDMEILSLADTGATHNIITKQTINNYGFDCLYLEGKDSIMGIGGEVEAEEALVGFNLLSLAECEDFVNESSYRSHFKVVPHYLMTPPEGQCDANGEQLPPIEALISSSFMAKQGWVLDFGAEIIYRRKSPALLKDAV